MSKVIVLVLLILVLSCLQRVTYQEIPYTRSTTLLMRILYVARCQTQYPMVASTFDYGLSDPVGSTYFDGCRDQFSAQCDIVNCSNSDEYIKWVDAFSVAGKNFTCSKDYKTVTETVLLHDNMTCALTYGLQAYDEIINMGSKLWSGNSITCSDMDNNIDQVTQSLDQCSDKGSLTLMVDYFRAVVDASPCRGKIQVNAAPTILASNSVLLISLALVPWVISSLNL